MHGIGELIQDHHIVIASSDYFFGIFPQGPRQVCALVQVPGTPGKAVSHGANSYAYFLGGALLPKIGGGMLDELEHYHLHVPSPSPEENAHGGGGLPLSVAGVDNYQPLVDAGSLYRLGPGLSGLF